MIDHHPRGRPEPALPDPPPPATTTPIDAGSGPVMVLRWPADADRRSALVIERVPRLLVLDGDDPAPLVWDDLEDWVRAGAGRTEIDARVQRLGARQPAPSAPLPVLDTDDVLRSGGHEVQLPPVEARLLQLLLDRHGRAVHREALRKAGWPRGGVNDRAVDGRITRLRRRLEPFGLSIATVRGVGYLIEPHPNARGPVPG